MTPMWPTAFRPAISMWGSFTQRYVKRHGRSSRFRPKASRCWRANVFLKPSHRITWEHRFQNTVEGRVFQGFPGISWLIFGRSQFQGFRNTATCREWIYSLSGGKPPRKPYGNRKGKWGVKTGVNSEFPCFFGHGYVALRTFASRNPSLSLIPPISRPPNRPWRHASSICNATSKSCPAYQRAFFVACSCSAASEARTSATDRPRDGSAFIAS